MNMLSKVPSPWFDSWNKVQNFVAKNIIPATSWSGGVVSTMADLIHPSADGSDGGDETSAERYGTTKELAKEIDKLRERFRVAEDTSAANEDAKLCIKKAGPGNWGACEDYEQYVRDLVERWRAGAAATSKLRVRVFYAESDMMIGKGGQAYLEKCWRQPGVEEVIDFKSEEFPNTSHDTVIIDTKKGALRRVFEEIKKLHE